MLWVSRARVAGAAAGLQLILSCACVHELAAFSSRLVLPVIACLHISSALWAGPSAYLCRASAGAGFKGPREAPPAPHAPASAVHALGAVLASLPSSVPRGCRRVASCPLFWALSCVLSRVSRRRGGLPEDYRRHREARDGQVSFPALRLVNSACASASFAVTEASERVSLPSVSRGRSADILALYIYTHSALTCAETQNPKL